ncbi:MAG: glycosyl hydrolase [Herbinix sp.]|jgi:type 1 glutamine amidotransferase|nr:glycosyl hydrolase [Herbinix sp.]
MSRILLLGDQSRPRYHSLQEIDPLLGRIQEFHEVVESEEYSELKKDQLFDFDVIINYIDNWQDRGNERAEQVLCEYLKEGGKILSIHNGIILKSAVELLRLHGASFQGHAAYDLLTYEKTQRNHFITQDMEPFSIYEEPYEFDFNGVQKVDIILDYHLNGKSYPAGWVTEEGRGRLVYLAFGHDRKTFENKPIQELILRSIDWLLSY